MSESASSGSGPRILRPETIMITVICVIVLATGLYFMSLRQQSLRASAAGLDGLQIWLSSNDVSAQNFSGGWLMDQTSIGLLVLPVYDSALDKSLVAASTKEELLLRQDEYDLTTQPILRKAGQVPALVVLPKWRSGMRLTKRAHPVLMIDPERIQQTIGRITGNENVELVRSKTPFSEFLYRSTEGRELRATIYGAQLFKDSGCKPIIGDADAMLLADCPISGETGAQDTGVFILSDPDLLNNHGLRLGDNAHIALDFLRGEAGDLNLVIDYSRSSWLRDPAAEPARQKTWADLERFLQPPFQILWIGAAFTMMLFLWRSSLRYGPVSADKTGMNASKVLAVTARARLMRLSGQDGALAAEYAAARISATATALFGAAHATHYASENEFLKYAERRHPEQAPHLRHVLAQIHSLPAHVTANEVIHHIDELEQVLEHIINDA